MILTSSLAHSMSMVWNLLVSGTSSAWQWATFSWMSELVTVNAEGLTQHVEDVLFKGESKIANIKGFRVSASKSPVRRALSKRLNWTSYASCTRSPAHCYSFKRTLRELRASHNLFNSNILILGLV